MLTIVENSSCLKVRRGWISRCFKVQRQSQATAKAPHFGDPEIVGMILQKVSVDGRDVGRSLLTPSSKIIGRVISAEGHVEVDKVKSFCKNFDGVEIVDEGSDAQWLRSVMGSLHWGH